MGQLGKLGKLGNQIGQPKSSLLLLTKLTEWSDDGVSLKSRSNPVKNWETREARGMVNKNKHRQPTYETNILDHYIVSDINNIYVISSSRPNIGKIS